MVLWNEVGSQTVALHVVSLAHVAHVVPVVHVEQVAVHLWQAGVPLTS